MVTQARERVLFNFPWVDGVLNAWPTPADVPLFRPPLDEQKTLRILYQSVMQEWMKKHTGEDALPLQDASAHDHTMEHNGRPLAVVEAYYTLLFHAWDANGWGTVDNVGFSFLPKTNTQPSQSIKEEAEPLKSPSQSIKEDAEPLKPPSQNITQEAEPPKNTIQFVTKIRRTVSVLDLDQTAKLCGFNAQTLITMIPNVELSVFHILDTKLHPVCICVNACCRATSIHDRKRVCTAGVCYPSHQGVPQYRRCGREGAVGSTLGEAQRTHSVVEHQGGAHVALAGGMHTRIGLCVALLHWAVDGKPQQSDQCGDGAGLRGPRWS